MSGDGPDYKYALKCIYNAHAADVRVVKPNNVPDGGFITGSRDNFVKVWIPDGKCYKESHLFIGANAYISSLCVLPPSAQYPKGLILAGSNDCYIYGFTPDSTEPVLRLLGHSGAVCSLSYGKFGFIVSGSWDKTARVWSGQQCILTLQGHQQAVWAAEIFPTQNLILTGSADRTIRLWRAGICEKVFTGHEDCVRGLAIISDMKFLSCANDNTVRMWLVTGECLEIYKSHTDYIYSITLLNHSADFATCGEDQTIKIWKKGKCAQTIAITPKSLWSISCLSNGDLAVGTSGGKVYVLEQVPKDYFERAAVLEHSEVPDMHSNKNDSLIITKGGPDTASSTYDGETVFIYEDGDTSMYVCKYNECGGTQIKRENLDFKVISDTLCFKSESEVTNNPQKPTKKTDYEFDVDVENTIYKLAFNKGDNPWDVANKFVADHNLLSEHVSQIVEYIIQNTGSAFCNEYIPAKNYLTYLNVNSVGLRQKLLEFSEHVPRENYLSPSEIDNLMLLIHFPDQVSTQQMSYLDKAIAWNDEYLFPVLDLLRLAVRCHGLRERATSTEFFNLLLRILMQTKRHVNQTLIEKIFCNMFGIEEAEEVLSHFQDKIFESVKEVASRHEKAQKAASTLFLNFAVASYKGFQLSTNMFCLTIIDILSHLKDREAIYRMLLAIGTACTRNTLAVTYFRSLNIKARLSEYANSDSHKIVKVQALLCSDF